MEMTQPTAPSPRPVHVLVIHRPNQSEAYAPYLRSEHFKVTEANDSDEGVTKALAVHPDFIVLDFDLDGETTRRLKAHIETRGIPVIALARMHEMGTPGLARE